ncbi:hypothetical protein TNCV_4136471 [Trichonephila clavipes]|nr:hypothetical protein TNCV_4136471 [Trichonephila clavipes]
MASLGPQSLPPTDLGGIDEEMAPPGGGHYNFSKPNVAISVRKLIHRRLLTLRNLFLNNSQTDHLIGTSAHALQRPMVTYTEMAIEGHDPHGLLRH